MYGNGQVQILQRLFSRATVVALFLVVLALLAVNFYTYLQDRKLQSVSLGAILMASWNLAQLGAEAAAFDREMALMSHGGRRRRGLFPALRRAMEPLRLSAP